MSLFGNFVILKAVRMEVLKKTRSFVLSRKAGEVFNRVRLSQRISRDK